MGKMRDTLTNLTKMQHKETCTRVALETNSSHGNLHLYWPVYVLTFVKSIATLSPYPCPFPGCRIICIWLFSLFDYVV